MTPAERLVSAIRDHERVSAAALPDTETNRLIRRLVEEERAWSSVACLQSLHRHVAGCEVPGAFVECGVAMGGCLALMAASAPDRTIWGFDSFEGLPDLTPADDGDGGLWVGIRCAGPEGEAAVADTFRRVGVPMDRVRTVKGWFAHTLPLFVADVGAVALLRVDCDWYEPTRYVLDMFYCSLEPGGVVIIDDYGSFAGCRNAVDEFRAERQCGPLHHRDGGREAYWMV